MNQQYPKNELRKEITTLISKVAEQSSILQQEPKQNELEQFLKNVEQLYQKTILLNYLNTLPENSVEASTSTPQTSRFNIPVQPQIVELPAAEKKTAPPVSQPEPAPVSESPTIPTSVIHTDNPLSAPAHTQHKNKPIQQSQPAGRDIRSMIGFNEKLMFMRNLFNGDAAAYDDTLNHLNTSSSVEEAEAFLTTIRKEYRWTAEAEAVELFTNLVKRRFL